MLKPLWILCHSTCVVSFTLLCFHSPHWYTTCALAVVATYALSIARHSARILSQPASDQVPLALLLDSENAAMLAAAYLHLNTPHSTIKLFPLAVYALLNISWYILHEAADPTPLQWILIELLRSTEPFLLTLASGMEFAVVWCYAYHWYTGQTLLIPLLCIFWNCCKRLVHCCMARLLVHNVVDTLVMVCASVPFSKTVVSLLVVFQRYFYCFVPVDLDIEIFGDNEVTRKESIGEAKIETGVPPQNSPRGQNLQSHLSNITPEQTQGSESHVRKQIAAYQRRATVNDAFLKKKLSQKYPITQVFLRAENAGKPFMEPRKLNITPARETYLALRDPGLEEEFLSHGNCRQRNRSFLEPYVINDMDS